MSWQRIAVTVTSEQDRRWVDLDGASLTLEQARALFDEGRITMAQRRREDSEMELLMAYVRDGLRPAIPFYDAAISERYRRGKAPHVSGKR